MDIWRLNLRHLRAIVAIAEHGSISAAARAISITQPAITQGLARLEDHLGERLFDRRSDGVATTPAAAIFVPRAASALAHIRSSRVTMVQLHALIALARAGSYADASRATGLSQPSLHRAVNDLAIVLRRVLVDRRGKGVMLTEQGRRTARAFRLAEAELRAGLSELAGLRGHDSSRIIVGAMPLSRVRLLPATIAHFLSAHSNCRIDVVEGAFSELIEPLRDGEIDFMIGALRFPPPDGLDQNPLFEDRPAVIGRHHHPLAGKNPDIKDLARYQWTVPPNETPLRENWNNWFARSGIEAPLVPVECGSVMTIRELLIATDYLTVLSPDQVRVELEAGWLIKIKDVPRWFHRTIGVTTRSGWRPTTLQQYFLDDLLQVVRQL